ncbi:MAG TPA: hypothetical protein V6D43_00360 [Candidatus Sericytochromatia bacterium]
MMLRLPKAVLLNTKTGMLKTRSLPQFSPLSARLSWDAVRLQSFLLKSH